MNVRILTSGLNDLSSGRQFYEAQREGLGEYFLSSLLSEIDSLAFYAGAHRKIMGFHRLLVHRFPYAIYYKIEADECAVVFRVLDCRQNPAKTAHALKSPPET
jgi:hypothetical protein